MLKVQIRTSAALPLEVGSNELLDTSKAPVATGGTSVVWKGLWLGQESVAIKKLKNPVQRQDLKVRVPRLIPPCPYASLSPTCLID